MIISGSSMSIGGLATGIDTKSVIDRLMQVESAGRTRVEWTHALWGERQTRWQGLLRDAEALAGASLDLLSAGAFADAGSAEKALDSWVTAYDTLMGRVVSQLAEERPNRPRTRGEFLAAPLSSDPRLFQLYEELRGLAATVLGEANPSAPDIGIRSNARGVAVSNLNSALLRLDSTALRNALAQDPGGVASAGVTLASKTRALVSSWRSDGTIDAALDGAGAQQVTLQRTLDRIDDRLATRRAYYERMFSQMETLVGKLKDQQAALTGAMASLPQRA